MEECRFRKKEMVNVYHCGHYGTTGSIDGCKTCPLTAEQKKLTKENTVPRSTYEHAMGRLKEMAEELFAERDNRQLWWDASNNKDKEIALLKIQSKQADVDLAKYALHVEKLEKTTDRLTMEVADWKTKCRTMQCERGIRRDTISQQKKEICRLEEVIRSLNSKLNALEGAHGRLQAWKSDEVERLELEIERLKQTLDDFHETSFSMADKVMEDRITVLEYQLKEYKEIKNSWEGIAGRHKDRLAKLTTIKDRWKKVALKRTKRIRGLKDVAEHLYKSWERSVGEEDVDLRTAVMELDYWRRSWHEMHSRFRTADSCAEALQEERDELEQRIKTLKDELTTLFELLRSSKEGISVELDNLASLETRAKAITDYKGVEDGS